MEFFNIEMSENFVAGKWVQKGTGCTNPGNEGECKGTKKFNSTAKMMVQPTAIKLK